MSGRRLVELRYALGSNLDPLRMEIFDDGIVDCGEHAAQFVFVFFEERHAESLQVRAETRARHDADALRAQQVIHKAVVEIRRFAAPFFDFLFDNRIVDFERLVAVEHAFAEDDGVVERTVRRVEIQLRVSERISLMMALRRPIFSLSAVRCSIKRGSPSTRGIVICGSVVEQTSTIFALSMARQKASNCSSLSRL